MSSLYIIHIINISEIVNAIYNTMEFNNKLIIHFDREIIYVGVTQCDE